TIRENDGNGRGRSLGWGCRRCAAGRNDCGHLAAHQFGRQRWQSVVLTLRRAVFDCDAVALDISGFVEALQERAEVAIINMHAAEIPDHWHRRLLRPRRERPRCRRAAEQRDELATFHLRGHSITSSASSRNGSEILNPSALPALTLT